MKGMNKLAAILSHDKGLVGLLSGVVLCGIGLVSVLVTACVWYL
jgi:hypothetical protein